VQRDGSDVQRVDFVNLKRQYASIEHEVEPAVLEVLRSTDYILGEEVRRFEEEWSEFCSTAYCVGVSSGTAALQLAYQAIGIGPGDQVIAPVNTFIATVLPLFRLGAEPVFVDCDEFGQIDVAKAAEAITPRVKAIAAVDLYGHPCDADALAALCESNDLVFVEDAAQAHGAEYKERRCGSLGDLAAFSFYPGKNLGAYGDGGAVVTDDESLADQIRVLRDLGQRRKYEHVVLGGNERLDTVQAAVLRVKLRHLEAWTEQRRAHAAAYEDLLEGSVRIPRVAPWAKPVWHLYVIRAENRDELRAALESGGVATGMHYPVPLHLQPALAMLGYGKGDFPVAEEWARTLLSLPMYAELRRDEIERVSEIVRSVGTLPVDSPGLPANLPAGTVIP
jgi:dTDP-4-amino-4,6-dideoxygalactose transaminase